MLKNLENILTSSKENLDNIFKKFKNLSYYGLISLIMAMSCGEKGPTTPTTLSNKPPETITLQPGPESKDTYVEIGYDNGVPKVYADNNYGDKKDLLISRADILNFGYTARTYIEFNLSELDSNIVINLATLKLWGYVLTPNSFSLQVQKVTSPWQENIITWNNQPSFSPLIETTTNVIRKRLWYDFNITDLVKSWYSHPETNYGLVLKLKPEEEERGYNFFIAVSSDDSIATSRPKLFITYTKK